MTTFRVDGDCLSRRQPSQLLIQLSQLSGIPNNERPFAEIVADRPTPLPEDAHKIVINPAEVDTSVAVTPVVTNIVRTPRPT
ncbi:hypothetical protein PtA15_11A702 [Puccinia triticina]|uniref:Uncharacterized protein n=1 Tax=Puccinia triticina TaxID=208348 RepID=A0ABY7CYI5_9BASI|nr:uncharacterized protein PtA15_11A702 [Puccinia triticina]WAQ90010.1 hypothetical protein PtA15_11A702 [Puccinia triticina]